MDAKQQLRDAWASVGDTIMDEVNRIRGITDPTNGGSFAAIMSQFNAATAAAQGGDQDAARELVGLSQSLIEAAELSATSRQELDRVKAMIAASLEETARAAGTSSVVDAARGTSGAILTGGTPEAVTLAAAATTAQAAPANASNDNLASELRSLREEVAQLRSENNSGHAATAGHAGKMARKLDDVTSASGGQAVSVAGVAK